MNHYYESKCIGSNTFHTFGSNYISIGHLKFTLMSHLCVRIQESSKKNSFFLVENLTQKDVYKFHHQFK